MKRVKYYVIHCTPEERDDGKEHRESFDSEKDAIKCAKEIPNNEFIAVEKHYEIYDRREWQVDWDNFGDKAIKTIDF